MNKNIEIQNKIKKIDGNVFKLCLNKCADQGHLNLKI
jgi:hypothetical protein